MVERGMGETVMRDKGKLRCNSNINTEGLSTSGDDAMWAVVLTKELWKEGVWCVSSAPHPVVAIDQNYRNDAKSVTIIALGCFHPVTKVPTAPLHFFLSSDEECMHLVMGKVMKRGQRTCM